MNIEDRLAKLERENRRWRLAAISLAGILGLSIACSRQWDEPAAGLGNQAPARPSDEPPIHDRLRVRTLEVVDDNGRTVGRWQCVGGLAGLDMWAGDNLVSLQASKKGASALFRGRDEETIVITGGVGVSRRGQKDETPLVLLGVSDDSVSGLINVYDSTGTPRVSMQGGEKGTGVFVYNTFGRQVGTLQSDKSDEGLLLIRDLRGNPVHALGAMGARIRQ
jgi:hypothetical protein